METFLKGCLASASYLISGSPFDATDTDLEDRESVVSATVNNNYDRQWKAHSPAPFHGDPSKFMAPGNATSTAPLLCQSIEGPHRNRQQSFTPGQHISKQTVGGGWVRPLGYAEKFMTAAHGYGCMTTVYSLWLDSRTPLSLDIIKYASTIMYRKMPNLRMELAERDGRLWWKEMTREIVNVEELDTQDVEAAVETLLKRRYNVKEGPLWFTRFIKLTPQEQGVRDDNHNLKYKYACLFGFHHNVSDGTTNMKFCKVFLKVLNDLVQGKEIDMCQEGTFAPPLQDRLADRIGAYFLFVYMFLRRLYTCILTFGIPVRNFTSRFPMPSRNEAATRMIHHELDEDTTRKLLRRCKMEGVTLNSAFTAAANLTMYKMMTQDGRLKTTDLWSSQAVNMRRYWPKEQQSNSFGCHISLLDVSFPTGPGDEKAFWKYARQVHARLKYHLTESKRALTLQPMSERLIILIRHNAWLAWLRLPSANDGHYTVTNMGDLTQTFPGTGEEVEVSLVLRSVSCHFMPTLCQHTLQTFRGRFCYSLDYYTQKITKENATTYAHGIMDFLRYAIHAPN
ncbi:uncharacterized protein LOC125028799 [Penaeus chinensis]|uniref:uncharacterized protein LOC125028799 n=1 Tax=Penaeus chinensis TaxID=139456 RepID=UPI001FB80505|nr:uncharacterized protein LOC125028799 [Penaeus chinensis]